MAQEITNDLLKILPYLRDNEKFKRNPLIEIHAVDLYQSGGIYRLANEAEPGFWIKQHEWLRRCLEIGAGYGVEFVTHAMVSKENRSQVELYTKFAEKVTEQVRYKSVKDKAKKTFQNPYLTGLPVTMYHIDWYLKQINGQGQLFCHTKDDAKSFSTMQSYESAQRRGHFDNLSLPVFKTCKQEPMIQIADAAGYVFLQSGVWYIDPSVNLKDDLKKWLLKYLKDKVIRIGAEPDLAFTESALGLLVEIIALNCGGPTEFRKKIRETLPIIISQAEKGEGKYFDVVMTDEGLTFSQDP